MTLPEVQSIRNYVDPAVKSPEKLNELLKTTQIAMRGQMGEFILRLREVSDIDSYITRQLSENNHFIGYLRKKVMMESRHK